MIGSTSPKRSKSTKLSFNGVISVSASECATWLSRVWLPGQSMMMKSDTGSSAAIAVVGASLAVYVFDLRIETIGSKFGGIPSSLPVPALPEVTFIRLRELFDDPLLVRSGRGMKRSPVVGKRR